MMRWAHTLAVLATVAALEPAGAQASELTIRQGDRGVVVAVVSTGMGPMVRAADVLLPLGAALIQDARDRYRLVIAGTELQLATGVAVARVKGASEQLAAAPAIAQGALYLPLSLLTDVLPRVVPAFVYDASTRELRRGGAVATRSSEDSAPRPAPADPRPTAPPRAAPPSSPRTPPRPRRLVVVLDAGHGGPDRGMRGRPGSRARLEEADITLAVALRTRDVLAAHGVDVIMTRATDTLIALADRGRIANRAKGDVFVSIHVNAANPRWRNPSAARGFETYFLAEAKTEDEARVAALENEAVKYEVESAAESGDPLSFILNDMKQNEYLRESSELAATMQRSLAAVHPGESRGVKQAGFRVLVGAFMPAVLVEVGFGSNPSEAAYLSSSGGQRALASSIADATMTYLSRYVGRRTPGATGSP